MFVTENTNLRNEKMGRETTLIGLLADDSVEFLPGLRERDCNCCGRLLGDEVRFRNPSVCGQIGGALKYVSLPGHKSADIHDEI